MVKISFNNETHLAYLDYLTSLVCDEYHARYYSRLLTMLFETTFAPTNYGLDCNRAADGLSMRRAYAVANSIDIYEFLLIFSKNVSSKYLSTFFDISI
mgnify:CR=1 FL=1